FSEALEVVLSSRSRDPDSVVIDGDARKAAERVAKQIDRYLSRFCVERVPNEFGDGFDRIARRGHLEEVVMLGLKSENNHRLTASKLSDGIDHNGYCHTRNVLALRNVLILFTCQSTPQGALIRRDIL